MKDNIIIICCIISATFLFRLQCNIEDARKKHIANLEYENKMYKQLIKTLEKEKSCDEQFFQLKGYTLYILEEHIKLYKKLYENNN